MIVRRGKFDWTPENEEYLRTALLGGASYREIADKIGISAAAVENRRRKLGLPSPSQIAMGITG